MNKNQLEIVKKNKKLQLSSSQILRHYKFAIFPFVLFLFSLVNSINSNGLSFDFFWGIDVWIWLIISVIIFLKQRKKLFFKEYKGIISKSDIKKALKRTINELDGLIELENDLFFQVFIKDPLGASDGDLITIILLENTFMVNSIADPRKNSFTFSSNRNKKNIKIYLKHLKDVIENKQENTNYLIPENEWTAKRIMTRLILYPSFIFIIILSIKLISEPIHYRSITAGFFGLIIGVGYIIIDLVLIVKKIKYNVQQNVK